jgi:hypothetical protein
MLARNPKLTLALIVSISLILPGHHARGQKVESFGVFAGLNFPFTLDMGLYNDPRYVGQFTLRASPFGFSYGYDNVGYGILVTPAYLQIGQKYIIQNTAGGEVGKRDIQMDYFTVPVALKLHLNDLAFFRLSIVAAINFDYLISGKEIVSHSASKLKYPTGVLIPSDAGYSSVYDGVFVPEVNRQVFVSKDKFKPFQLSAGVGFHSDFDFNDDWSMSFDGRAVFGIFDPRKSSYINDLKAAPPTTDLYGQRREIFLGATIGICRIIQIKEKFRPKSTGKTGDNRKPRTNSRRPRD